MVQASGRSRRLGSAQAIIGWSALLLTLLSALPLGSNRPVAWIALAVLALVLLAAQLAVDASDREPTSRSGKLWLPGLLALAALAWGIAQTSPGATRVLTGAISAVAPMLGWDGTVDLVHPLWRSVDAPGAISADPVDGRHSALRVIAYLALFWIFVRTAESGTRALRMIQAIALFIAALGAFGLFAAATGNNVILGQAGNGLSASFVNRNSFATYAAFGAIANLALLLDAARARPADDGRGRALRQFLEDFFSGGWLFTAGFLVCATALVASQSRGGALAGVAGLATVLVMARANARHGAGPVVWLVLAAALFVFATSATGLLERLIATEAEETRFAIYGAVVEAIADRPLLGHGLGSFQDVFRAYVPPVGAWAEWDMAHNTYLEIAFELGLPAAASFFLAVLLVIARVARGALVRRRNLAVPLTGIGIAVTGAVHSAFDFSLQIPAIAAVFAAILGLAWTQSFRTEPGR